MDDKKKMCEKCKSYWKLSKTYDIYTPTGSADELCFHLSSPPIIASNFDEKAFFFLEQLPDLLY